LGQADVDTSSPITKAIRASGFAQTGAGPGAGQSIYVGSRLHRFARQLHRMAQEETGRMSVQLDLSGLDIIIAKLASLKTLDATPLMRTWMNIISEDNRTGVLAGLDKDGVPMVPVRYRPKPPPGMRVTDRLSGKANAYHRESLKQFRLGQGANKRKGMFAGLGPAISGMHNNLSTAEYQLLSGPPLAPRDQFSRVITNLKTSFTGPPYGEQEWQAIGAWDQVVNQKGLPFLFYHFNGIGLPRRDLRGVRPNGIVKAMDALRNWARLAIREHFGH
jgi:hypothetical protein